jgi:hypothetical protein
VTNNRCITVSSVVRVMGKALFDRQLVAGHMVQSVYKHMLGWPIAFRDLQNVDEEYYVQ